MTTIPSTREEHRNERMARVLALIPNAAYEPKGVTAYAIHRRTGLGLQAVGGALERLVKAGRVKRIRMGRDNGARYVIETAAAIDESQPLTPVELYRLEKQKRRDRVHR
jgi:DNA-binding transcriptional ArsR family regulator